MNEMIKDLKKILSGAVKGSAYKGLLFSGGLDTSILAAIKPKVIGITVSLESEGEDIHYAGLLAKQLDMEHFHRKVDPDEAIDAIPEVVKILKSFDPAIPNDLVVYFGLRCARELGIHEMGTGDGSDELFGGYSFMEEMADLEAYIQRIAERMHFSSNDLGDFFGIRIIQPFMSKDVMDYALRIPAGLKIRRENGKVRGKWILRKAFEDLLPGDMIWQGKRPLEYGSGMTRLRQVISERVSDEEFRGDSRPVKLINKEHLYYYKIYRQYVGDMPKPGDGEKTCPGCGAGINMDGFHCRICGHVMDWRV